MYGFLKSRFGSGLKDEDKYCLVKTAKTCGECVYNNTCTGMRGICRKCGKYREENMSDFTEAQNAAYSG